MIWLSSYASDHCRKIFENGINGEPHTCRVLDYSHYGYFWLTYQKAYLTFPEAANVSQFPDVVLEYLSTIQ